MDGRPAAGWRALLLDGTVGLLLGLAGTPNIERYGPGAVPVFAALGLPLLVRRRYPVPVFAVVSGAALVQWLTLSRLGVYDLAVLVALYSVAAYAGRRWSLVALGISLLGSVLAWFGPMGAGHGRPQGSGPNYLGLVPPLVVVVAVWLVGRNMRTRRQYLAELEQRAVRLERERDALARAAVAEERARIAREMHDVVAHTVAVMVAQAQGAGASVRTDPDQAERALEVISEAGRTALAELRRTLGVLRASGPEALPRPDPPAGAPVGARPGTQTAPQPADTDLDALVAAMRASGLPVRFVRDGAGGTLDPTLGLAVYRIVQESLTNTLKHSGPGTATRVLLRRLPDRVEIEVVDAGTGTADQEPPAPGGGHGLTGMRERAALFAGALTAGPAPAGGWRVHAVLPTGGTDG